MENMNAMQMFANEDFGQLRAVVIEGKAWFFGEDAVRALEYNLEGKHVYSEYVKKYCEEEDYVLVDKNSPLIYGSVINYKDLGQRGGLIINEYAVISLVLQSPMPKAKQFKRWVTHEVIPSILATGKYEYNKKEEKQKFNPLQECALIVFGEDSSDVEKVNALNNLHKISIMQGERMICDDSMITIPQIREMVYKHYGDELDEKGAIISETFIEFNRYMKYAGYLHTIQFPRKDGRGLEKMYTYQPTKLFDEVLVAQGMATVRTLSDDRGKVEITYTKNIENLIVTESFKESFFKYIQLTTPMCA